MRSLTRLLRAFQLISISVLIVGALFMIQHYPYGREMVFYGKIAFLIASLWKIAILPNKSYGHYAGLVAILCGTAYMSEIEGLLFLDNYLFIIGGIAGLVWFWDVGMEAEFSILLVPMHGQGNGIVRVVGYASAILIFIGALFKIQHYPGADILLMVGFGILVIQFIVSLFSSNN